MRSQIVTFFKALQAKSLQREESKMTARQFVIVSLLLTSFISLLSCCDENPVDSSMNGNAQASFSGDVGLQDQGKIRIEGVTGTIHVVGSSDATMLKVEAVKRVESRSDSDAEAQLQLLDIVITKLSDEVLIRTVQPENSAGRNYIVDYTVTMPASLQLGVSNITGLISVTSIHQSVAINNITGEILFQDIVGDLDIQAITGMIDGDVHLPVDGSIDISLVTGNVDVVIPTGTSAQVTASVVTGNINLSNLQLQDAASTPTSLAGKLADGNGRIAIRTVTGNIRLSGI